MTLEQLKAARAQKWRQTENALLTLDQTQTWIEETGLVLYLPRRAQLPVEAPSFVEAVLGRQDSTPKRESVEEANSLLNRLAAEEAVIPLNLMGTVGEQPDFLASVQVLPYIFALRGNRDWKHAPQAGGVRSVSPLIAHVYKALEKDGRATIFELRDRLGSELTEAAILRALTELWSELRVIPIFNNDGEPTLWEPLKQRFSKALAQGTSTSQLTAISVLTSLWLQTAIAATAEETEIFLSPLTSRSKIREVLRGLSATRQVESLSTAYNTYYFVGGTLPEFPEVTESLSEAAPEPQAPPLPRERPAGNFAGRRSPRSSPWSQRPERKEPGRERQERPPMRDFDRRPSAPARGRTGGGFQDRDRKEGGQERRQSFDRTASRGFPKREERGEQPSTFRRREDDQTGERPRFRRPAEGGEQSRRFAGRSNREERSSRPWQKREDRPERGRQQCGYAKGGYNTKRGGGQDQGRGEGQNRRRFEEGSFRPPRRQQGGGEEEPRQRRPRWEGQGQERPRPFNKPRSDRPGQGRGFEKRSEGRGASGFVRSGERREERGTRPPHREAKWKPKEEGDRERETRPGREAGPGARPAGRFRSDRPSQGTRNRPGGFGAKGGGGKPKSGGGGFGKKSPGGKFSSKPGNRSAKKFGRKERPE